MSESMFSTTPDEALLRELYDCCNSRCYIIEEVIRRFNEYKGPPDLEELTDEI